MIFYALRSESNPISVPQKPEEVGVYGPGHHAVWSDASTGKFWVWYHQKDTLDNGWNRRICVDELKFQHKQDGGASLLLPVTRD